MVDEKSPEGALAPAVESTPKYLTSEDFNKASSAREARLLARIEKMLGASKAPTVTEDDSDAPAPAPKVGETRDDKEARLAKVEAELTRERKARKEEKARASRDEERSKVSELLSSAGIPAPRMKGALAVLHEVDKRVVRDSDGTIMFRDDEEGEIPLAEGVKKWLSTDEGKAYLPPRGAQGVGLQRGNASVTPAGNPKAAAQMAARSSLLNLLRR